MFTYFEERKRLGKDEVLYKICSWYFLGLLIWHQYTQLTVRMCDALPQEKD